MQHDETAIAPPDAGAQLFVMPGVELSAVDGDRLDVRAVADLSRAVQLVPAARRTVPKVTRQDGGTRS